MCGKETKFRKIVRLLVKEELNNSTVAPTPQSTGMAGLISIKNRIEAEIADLADIKRRIEDLEKRALESMQGSRQDEETNPVSIQSIDANMDILKSIAQRIDAERKDLQNIKKQMDALESKLGVK